MFSKLFCLLQNKYVFIVKTVKYDYRFSESFGGPLFGESVVGGKVVGDVGHWPVDLIKSRKKHV